MLRSDRKDDGAFLNMGLAGTNTPGLLQLGTEAIQTSNLLWQSSRWSPRQEVEGYT
jgi:hypothetical protein